MNNIEDENCISIDFIPDDGENTFGHFISSEKTNDNNR